jgi:outer membrane protein assembly factor BamA
VLSFALLATPLAAQEPVEDRGREVTGLRFEGETIFDDLALKGAIVTRATSCRLPFPLSAATCTLGWLRERQEYDDAALKADLVRLQFFYYREGYRQAQIRADTVGNKRGVKVVIHVDAGEPVRVASLRIEGGDGVLPDDVARTLPLRAGQPFSLLAAEASRDSLVALMKNRGYPNADALVGSRIQNDAPTEAHVRFDLIPGPRARIGEIEIRGNDRIPKAVIERMLTVHPGDLYRQRELQNSQSNLFGLEVFRYAAVQARPDAESDSIVPIAVQVTEDDLHRIRLGAGVNQADCFNAEGRWTSRNFMGGARRLEVRGAIANVLATRIATLPCDQTGGGRYDELTGSLGLDFTQPWFFGPRNTLGAGLFVERRSVPEVFIRNARGAYFSLSRSLGGRTALSLSYRPQLTWLDAEGDLFFCTNFVTCEQKDIQILKSPHWLAPVQLGFTRDRSNALFSPSRGYILRLEAERAAGVFGSDFAYLRLAGDLSYYKGVMPGVVLAAHLRPGWARALADPGGSGSLGLNPQRRFFAGGPNSVRGFAQYRLGPKVLKVEGTRLAMPVDSGGAGCTAEQINSGSCSASLIAANRFDPRPVGGAAALEGGLELRFPLAGDKWSGAAFVDFGQVWKADPLAERKEDREIRLRDLVFTPGIGVRYFSPIGPIRVDVGYNGLGGESLQVITNEIEPKAGGSGYTNTGRFRLLNDRVLWEPRRTFFDRLQLHFSIGQAF